MASQSPTVLESGTDVYADLQERDARIKALTPLITPRSAGNIEAYRLKKHAKRLDRGRESR